MDQSNLPYNKLLSIPNDSIIQFELPENIEDEAKIT